MSKHLIDFIGISKSYDSNLVLDDLNLYIRENEFLTLLGPSGCGKTTTLRLLGGFESPDKGQILFDGQDITALAANERKLNTVFQKYSLFPHMSIAENIAFGLKISKKSKAYIQDKIKYALKLVNLEGFENRSVDSLSGGQQQRIAIARAIVNEPKVLLLDEPLGALDLKLRQSMQYELIRLKEELGITFVYVTHDQEEALTMSDTIVVMNQGYIQQIGTPENIYNEPENAFVADFIGHSNIIDGTMIKDELVEILGARWACVDKGFGNNKPVDVVIRPEDVELVDPSEGTLQGEVTSLIFKGVHYELDVMASGYEWLVHTTRFVPVGTKVGIKVIPFNIQIMHKPESSDEKAVEKFKQQFLAGPYLIWIIGFILLPLIMILYYGFTNGDGSFTLSYITAIADETNRKAMGLSLRLGIICTIVCLVLSYPLAMILNNMKIKNQGLVVFIFMLPMWMNFMLRILAWKLLLSKNGVINSILTGFGLSRINIINTPTAVVLGMVYDFLPFMLLPIYNSMTRIRKDWIEAARDLGAGNVTIFFKIILPLTVSGIISGIVMVFVPSLTSFAISQVLGGGHVLLIGNVIEQDFMQGMQWNAGSGLSFVLMIFVIVSMTIVNIFDKEGEGTSIC